MKSIALLMCLGAAAQFAEAQYKAILSTPTAPLPTQSGTGDVKGLVNLRAIGGGYAWGQYFGRAVKVSLTDGSITFLENSALPAYPVDFSAVLATDGNNAIGYTGGATEACVSWDANGFPTTFTTPLFQETICSAASGGVLGGYLENNTTGGGGLLPSTQRAVIWTSPTSFTDLHTGGNNFSEVLGMAGNQQVGFQSPSMVYGQTGNLFFGGLYGALPGNYSAYLWHGSTSGAVNLNPAAFTSSVAFATNGSQQGGYAYDSTPRRHAMLWSGTAASALDLSSPGWFDTEVRSLSATMQVGDGYEAQFSTSIANPVRHALAWSGSSASVIDLNIFLPPGYMEGVANAIDADGNIVGHAWMQVGRGYSFAPVIFKPEPASPSQLLSVTLSAGEINQGDSAQGQVTLAGPAPAGGEMITLYAMFQDGNPISDLVPVPTRVMVLEGQTTAFFDFTTHSRYADIGGQYWTRVYAYDGTVSRFALLKVDMQPFLTAFTIPAPVYGGTTGTGTVSTDGYSYPSGTAVVSLISGSPAILTVPATVPMPVGLPIPPTATFPITTAQVTTATVVPVTASINNTFMTVNVTVLPAPPATLTGISVSQEVVAGSSYTGTLTFNSPVPFGGATVSLVSDNPAVVPVPATVSALQGQSTISFSGVTGAVAASVTAHITATYNGISLTAPITVNDAPPVKITNAEYDTIALVVKVSATTQVANSTLTFGIDTAPGTVVPMSLSNGVWSGSLKNVKSAPGLITVWNSNGGSASMAPTLRNK